MALNRNLISVGNSDTVMSVLWENEFKNKINHILAEVASSEDLAAAVAVPQGYISNFLPKYLGNSTIQLSPGFCRDSTNTTPMSLLNPVTIDLDVAGSLGTPQSVNLGGTVSVTINTTGVTGSGTSFLSNFQVGDIISVSGSSTRRIATITSNTQMTVESPFAITANNTTYKRGGRAPNTFYYLYVLTNSTNSTIAFLSTRNTSTGQILVDVPSGGYTKSRQLVCCITTDASANILPFRIGSGWPYRPTIIYTDAEFAAPYWIVTDFASTSWTPITTASKLVPPIARLANMDFQQGVGSGTNTFFYRETGRTIATGRMLTTVSSSYVSTNGLVDLPLSTDQRFDLRSSTTAPGMNVVLTGYTITELA